MPTGVAKTIEDILKELGKDIKLAREGVNRWEVREGSAKIKITYNAENYFVVGDAYLCQLPQDALENKTTLSVPAAGKLPYEQFGVKLSEPEYRIVVHYVRSRYHQGRWGKGF